MKWADCYIKIEDWAVSTAVNKISALEDMGTPDEVVDALLIIAFKDKKGAARLLNKALQSGMKFSGESPVEISDQCTEESFKKALYQSSESLTAKDLEYMYGYLDGEIILDLSKRYGIAVLRHMADECNVSFIDRMSKGLLTSLWKHSSLSKTDAEIRQAQNALAALNTELRILSDNRSVQLKYSRLASMIDMWFDNDALDALQYLRIEKAWKRTGKAIKQVENIRQELLGAIRLNDRQEF